MNDDNVWNEGAGGAEPAPAEPTQAAPDTPATPEPVTTEPEVAATPTPAPASGADAQWTPERVAELLRTAREPVGQEPPQMSPEEMNRLLNVVNVSQEQLGAIVGGGENALQTLNDLLQAVVLQARTTSWYQTQLLMKQMDQRMAPVMDFYQQAQQERLTSEFFKEFKEFSPEKHTRLLAAAKSSLDAEGAFNGKKKAESFKMIADRAKELLTASGTPLAPVASGPGNGSTGMAQLSRGAGHGAAAAVAGGTSSGNPVAKRIFG